jgi:hypothetical protein
VPLVDGQAEEGQFGREFVLFRRGLSVLCWEGGRLLRQGFEVALTLSVDYCTTTIWSMVGQ